MYCAVHSPIPGSALNLKIASSRLAPRLKIAGSAEIACASEVITIARAPVRPRVVCGAATAGKGKQMAEALATVITGGSGSPKAWTRRRSSLVAALR